VHALAQTRSKTKWKPSPQDISERYKTCTVRDVELHSTETDEDMEAIDPAIAGVSSHSNASLLFIV
jgi:hypothetical protein